MYTLQAIDTNTMTTVYNLTVEDLDEAERIIGITLRRDYDYAVARDGDMKYLVTEIPEAYELDYSDVDNG